MLVRRGQVQLRSSGDGHVWLIPAQPRPNSAILGDEATILGPSSLACCARPAALPDWSYGTCPRRGVLSRSSSPGTLPRGSLTSPLAFGGRVTRVRCLTSLRRPTMTRLHRCHPRRTIAGSRQRVASRSSCSRSGGRHDFELVADLLPLTCTTHVIVLLGSAAPELPRPKGARHRRLCALSSVLGPLSSAVIRREQRYSARRTFGRLNVTAGRARPARRRLPSVA